MGGTASFTTAIDKESCCFWDRTLKRNVSLNPVGWWNPCLWCPTEPHSLPQVTQPRSRSQRAGANAWVQTALHQSIFQLPLCFPRHLNIAVPNLMQMRVPSTWLSVGKALSVILYLQVYESSSCIQIFCNRFTGIVRSVTVGSVRAITVCRHYSLTFGEN